MLKNEVNGELTGVHGMTRKSGATGLRLRERQRRRAASHGVPQSLQSAVRLRAMIPGSHRILSPEHQQASTSHGRRRLVNLENDNPLQRNAARGRTQLDRHKPRTFTRRARFCSGRESLRRRSFVILSGWVKLYRITPDGIEVVLHVFTRGETFAEAAMFSAGIRRAPKPSRPRACCVSRGRFSGRAFRSGRSWPCRRWPPRPSS